MDKRLIWLAVGAFAVSTVGFVFSALLPAIAADAHVTIPQAGHLITAFSLAYAVGAPVLSALAGAVDRRKVLAAAMFAFVAGNLAAAASGSFEALFLSQLVMGMAAGLFAATAQATAVALAGFEHRARAIAVVVGGTTFAVALGAPAASLVGNLWGWRGTFLSIAGLGLVCATILLARLPRDSRGARMSLRERFAVVGRRGILPALAVTFLYLTGAFTVIAYMAPLAMQGAGLPEMALPAMLLVFGTGAVIGNLSSGYFADRIGATRVVVLSMVASAAICVSMALVLKLLPHHLSGPLLIGLMLPWGIVGWTFPPAQVSRIVAAAPDVAHLTLGLNASALYLGIAFGTLLGGRVLEMAAPADLGLAGAALPLLALTLLAATQKRRRPAGAAA